MAVSKNGTSAMGVSKNETSVMGVSKNGTSAMGVSENGTSVMKVSENGTLVLEVTKNATSVLGAAENGTSGRPMMYSSEVERILLISFVGLSTVFTLWTQLLVLVKIIKSPKLHNAHFYHLGVYCCVDITLVSISGASIITPFVDGSMPTLVCARAIIKVPGHPPWWLAGGYDLEIRHF